MIRGETEDDATDIVGCKGDEEHEGRNTKMADRPGTVTGCAGDMWTCRSRVLFASGMHAKDHPGGVAAENPIWGFQTEFRIARCVYRQDLLVRGSGAHLDHRATKGDAKLHRLAEGDTGIADGIPRLPEPRFHP